MNKQQEQVFNLLSAFANICDSEKIWYTLSYGSVLGAIRHQGFIPWDTDADVFIRGDQLEMAIDVFNSKLPENMCLYTFGEKTHYSLSNLRVGYKDGSSKKGPYVDLFILMGMPDNKLLQEKKMKRCKKNSKFFSCKYKDISTSKAKNVVPILCLKPISWLFSDKKIAKKYISEIKEYPLDKSKYVCALSCYYGMKESFLSQNILIREQVRFENRNFYVPKEYDMYLTQLYGNYMVPKKY